MPATGCASCGSARELAERLLRERRPPRRRGARGHRAQRALRRSDRLACPHDPPLRSAGSGGVSRALGPRRGRGRAVPDLLRRGLPRAGRRTADRERAAGAAHAHRRCLSLADRRALARPASPGASECRRSASRSTLPTPRSSAPSSPPTRASSGSPPTRSWSSSATWRSSVSAPLSRTSRTRTACLPRGCRTARGELDLDPVVRRLGQVRELHRRGDQRARSRELGRHEERVPPDRAGARRRR